MVVIVRQERVWHWLGCIYVMLAISPFNRPWWKLLCPPPPPPDPRKRHLEGSSSVPSLTSQQQPVFSSLVLLWLCRHCVWMLLMQSEHFLQPCALHWKLSVLNRKKAFTVRRPRQCFMWEHSLCFLFVVVVVGREWNGSVAKIMGGGSWTDWYK